MIEGKKYQFPTEAEQREAFPDVFRLADAMVAFGRGPEPTLDHVKWAAWGVIDIETMERMQRRKYLQCVRKQLKSVGIALECGGNRKSPYYSVHTSDEPPTGARWTYTRGTHEEAFKGLCQAVLKYLEEHSPEA